MRYVGSAPTSFGEDRKKYVVGSGGVNAGDTVFNVSYDEGKVDAYLNGIRLFPDTDFTRTASGVGSNITLASGVGAGDVLELFGLQGVHGGNGLVEDRFVVGTGSTGSGGSYTNSTTVFPTASNVGDTVSVWRNGVKLVHTTDYTVQPTASTVTLSSAALTADEICIQVVGIVTSANFIPKTGGTFTGEVVVPTLKLSSNVIKASDGGSTITLDTSDNVTIAGGLTVTQDFTVNGTTTTVNTTNTVVEDSLIGLNNGATSNTNDCGLIIERGSTGNDALIMWDESEDKWTLGTSTSTASSTGNLNITVGTLVANLEGNVTGTIQTAAQANITSVGTLTSATISGDLTVDTSTLKVDSSNNRVGIGNSSPISPVHINVNATDSIPTNQLIQQGDDNVLVIRNTNNSANYSGIKLEVRSSGASGWLIANEWQSQYKGDLVFRGRYDGADSAERMRITSSGNVGIGATPSVNLHIVEDATEGTPSFAGATHFVVQATASSSDNVNASLISGTLGTSRIMFGDKDDEDIGKIEYANSDNGMKFFTNTTERMRIDSSGNVGIGTSSPGEIFEVAKTSDATIRLNYGNPGTSDGEDYYGGIEFYSTETSYNGPAVSAYVRAIHTRAGTGHNNADAGLVFGTSEGSGLLPAIERMRIASAGSGDVTIKTGNLVIGTAGKGINFSSTNTPAQSTGTGSHNTLDDYEHGTFTVNIQRNASDPASGTGPNAKGRYVKVGDLVHVSIYTDLFVSHGTPASGQSVVITSGLPFVPTIGGGSQVAHTRTINNPDKVAICWVANSNTIYLNETGTNNNTTPSNNVTSSNNQSYTTLIWSGSFYTG